MGVLGSGVSRSVRQRCAPRCRRARAGGRRRRRAGARRTSSRLPVGRPLEPSGHRARRPRGAAGARGRAAPADPHRAREGAHVDASLGERRDDAKAMRVRERREDPGQLVAGRAIVFVRDAASCVRASLHVSARVAERQGALRSGHGARAPRDVARHRHATARAGGRGRPARGRGAARDPRRRDGGGGHDAVARARRGARARVLHHRGASPSRGAPDGRPRRERRRGRCPGRRPRHDPALVLHVVVVRGLREGRARGGRRRRAARRERPRGRLRGAGRSAARARARRRRRSP